MMNVILSEYGHLEDGYEIVCRFKSGETSLIRIGDHIDGFNKTIIKIERVWESKYGTQTSKLIKYINTSEIEEVLVVKEDRI